MPCVHAVRHTCGRNGLAVFLRAFAELARRLCLGIRAANARIDIIQQTLAQRIANTYQAYKNTRDDSEFQKYAGWFHGFKVVYNANLKNYYEL